MSNIFQKISFPLFLSGLLGSGAAMASVPSGYYDSLEGLSGVKLKKAVKALTQKSFKSIPYGTKSSTCTWQVFLDSDTRYIGGTRYWWDMYSNYNRLAPDQFTHEKMNIEHCVPNSWWGKDANARPYVDIYNLNPSDEEANSHKGNYPLGKAAVVTWSNDGNFTTVGNPATGTCGGSNYVFEPADEYKGDFARAYFYIFTAYDNADWKSNTSWMYDPLSELTLKPWAYQMLLEWAENDPVSQKEKDRNEAINKHQWNRNPFIDCPQLARHIWGDLRNTPFHYGVTPAPVEETIKGYWVPVTSRDDINSDDKYMIASASSHIALSVYTPIFDVPNYMLQCASLPEFDGSVYANSVAKVPDDVAVLKFIPEGTGWKIAVSDRNGVLRGYLNSKTAKQMNLTQDINADGTVVNINPYTSRTDFVFSSGAGYLKYNNNDNGKRFTTYTGGQENVMLYRYVSVAPDEEEGGGEGDVEWREFNITEDFTRTGLGLPEGSVNRPSTAKKYTSKETGIEYTIMGCYVNNYEAPYYLLVNGKNNEGAFLSFALEANCSQIVLNTTSSCSTNNNSTVNVYADGNLLGNYKVNVQNTEFTVEIPEEYQKAGTIYKIESGSTAYNQQFAGFTYVCYEGEKPGASTQVGEIAEAPDDGEVRVYSINGRLLNVTPDKLGKGIYIIKAGGHTYKVIK